MGELNWHSREVNELRDVILNRARDAEQRSKKARDEGKAEAADACAHYAAGFMDAWAEIVLRQDPEQPLGKSAEAAE